MLKPLIINAMTIPDAWFQALYWLVECYQDSMLPQAGVRRYIVEAGSNPGEDRFEFDFATVQIHYPGVRPLIPQMPEDLNLPSIADEAYLADYMRYLLTRGEVFPEVGENEHYTYGERIHHQFTYIIEYYKKHGPGTNRMCIEVGRPEDIFFYDADDGSTPCLRLIDTRIKDGRLHWMVYFRSWNLWNGFPVNLAGLQQCKELMASEIGVEDGEIIAMSKGLNLRGYNFDVAMQRLRRINA